MKNSKIEAALRQIAEENGGVLMPESVVEAARDVRSVLHSKFTWDDTVAAQRYRLDQARNLIRCSVQIIDSNVGKTPVFVSLSTDRKEGGYRLTTTVMDDESMRHQLLQDALHDLNSLQQKYRRLSELAAVLEQAKEKVEKLA